MNQLCLLTNMTSADVAAWAQAAVQTLAIVAGAGAVWWQVRKGREESFERQALARDGLARLLSHLREAAVEARAEKKKLERWPAGHPAEPSSRFTELATALKSYPLETIDADVPFQAILSARRVATEMSPLVGPEPELDVNPQFEETFGDYLSLLDQQIQLLRQDGDNLVAGKRLRYELNSPSAG